MRKNEERIKTPDGALKQETLNKQIGAKIDADLWMQMRMLALMQGTTATKLLNEAMREYLDKHRSRRGGKKAGDRGFPLDRSGSE